jgi:PHP family Zn ribbon phosphoesterase
MSGFDSLEEGYGSESKQIWAVETGISSDPPMAWRVGALDGIRLISNSDPHSLRRLGREANVLELEPKDLSYQGLIQALQGRGPGQLQYTVEFFPEEGRYHFDGHDACGFSCSPTESRRLKSLCPICGKKLTLGTLHRVDALASQLSGSEATVDRVPYKHTLQLEEVIASSLGVGSSSKKVQTLYMQVTDQWPEFEILFDLSESELSALLGPSIGQDLMRVRRGQVKLEPGFDGRYGKVSILKKSSDLFAIAG